jgi:hypothetical protein
LETRVVEAITEWVGETAPEHAIAAAREAITIVRDALAPEQDKEAVQPDGFINDYD